MAKRLDGAFASVTTGRGRFLRPTGGRERVYAGQNISIEILGLRAAEKIPMELRTTYELMMRKLELALERACREVVPGGATGRLAMQVHGHRVGQRIVIGTVGSQFARALNRGFTSTPKRARALRFYEEGELVFTKRVRVAGRHFFEKWLLVSPPIVEAIYDSSFHDIKDLL